MQMLVMHGWRKWITLASRIHDQLLAITFFDAVAKSIRQSAFPITDLAALLKSHKTGQQKYGCNLFHR